MPDVQNLFNAHLLGKAVGKMGCPETPLSSGETQISGNPNNPDVGLHLPSSTGGFRETKRGSGVMISLRFLATYSFSSLSRVPRQSILPRRTLWQKSRGRSSITKCSVLKL